MSAFSLDILTPQGVVLQKFSCKALFVPTVKGEINVLKDHTHILTELSSGILTAVDLSNHNHYFHVTVGVCKVLGDKISVLTATSEAAEKIDLARAEKAKAKATQMLSASTLTEEEYTKYSRKLERSEARIKLAGKK